MSGNSGGEPLSEELERRIVDIGHEIYRSHAGQGTARPVLVILRAFASEILESAAREVASERPKALQSFGESSARVALLASQERCRSLSEALEKIEEDPECNCLEINSKHHSRCPAKRAAAALSAYRSSEAGRGKP